MEIFYFMPGAQGENI